MNEKEARLKDINTMEEEIYYLKMRIKDTNMRIDNLICLWLGSTGILFILIFILFYCFVQTY